MPHLELQADSVEEAGAILRRRYTVRIDVTGAAWGLQLVQDSIAGVEFSRIRYAMDFTLATEQPMHGTFIARLRSGELAYRFGRQENRWKAGDVFVAAPAGSTLDSSIHHCWLDLVLVDPATFASIAHTADGRPVALTGYVPVTPAAAGSWSAALDYAQQLTAQPDLSPLVAGVAARLVAATALATFPHNAVTEPDAGDRRAAHPLTVRRAVAYMDSHLDHDISLVDIAQAAYVTPRALQVAFRRHLDTTPIRYLRRARLDRAHQDLLTGTPESTTVTAVAGRWGFASPSTFARFYRAAYGDPPSCTLHR